MGWGCVVCYALLYLHTSSVVLAESSCERGAEKASRYVDRYTIDCLTTGFQGTEPDCTMRFLLYDVNPGEGFNLRRDVYLRMANFVRRLNEKEPWILVLPPWGNLYHWRHAESHDFVPWSNFFDVSSLNKWVPVIEYADYVKEMGPAVDTAFRLQHYEGDWDGSAWNKFDIEPCNQGSSLRVNDKGESYAAVWGREIIIRNFSCVSVLGYASTIQPIVIQESSGRSVLLGHAETILHDEFGGVWYWSARRSMRFATHLVEEADAFRKAYLNSDDVKDGTVKTADWRDQKPSRNTAGGPYIAVHLRRRDFVRARREEVPSIKSAAKQLRKILESVKLETVFVATDAPEEEFEELVELLKEYKVLKYRSSKDFFLKWGDGGVAIVDQIIASHARYFTGTYESTFSFRIEEEREILGFPIDSSFNRLCGRAKKCEQPSKWLIVY